MQRREFLGLAAGAAISHLALPAFSAGAANDLMRRFRSARGRAVIAGAPAARLAVEQNWKGNRCTARVSNPGREPVRVREVLLAEVPLRLGPEAALYGESFQMLSQTAGTVAHPLDLGYSERQHYQLPQPEGATALSGMVLLNEEILIGFTSCRRFSGRFYLAGDSLQAVMDTEGLELGPGEAWELEELMLAQGARAADLTAALVARIAHHHPVTLPPSAPTGWCSWYCFGPRVTARQVLDNLEVIAREVPGLRYVQIDDGYQPAMGDWLETGSAFGGDVQSVLRAIRERGFEPAIWVAPFIAESSSHLFQQHPEWFMSGADGQPLPSNQVTFGGWRHGPWYALDGTHPEAQQHLERLFRTLRQEWGCTYFKLDANFWGAMHGGRLHDRKATRIEAYRCGMQAVRRGAGDAFILGCNHPVWGSFGLIDGSRSSGDIKRQWTTFAREARQTLYRNWQNGTLWWNDPDAVLLTGALSDDEFMFHATATYASGGMVLSGDDLTTISPSRLAVLRKLLPPTGVAARFDDRSLRVGWVKLRDAAMACVFNWGDAPQTVSLRLPGRVRVTDYWTGADLGVHQGEYALPDMPPHSARLLRCA